MYYVYKLTHIESGKSYIGKTNSFKRRLREHQSSANCGSPYHIHNAIRKYGIDSFTHEILFQSEDEQECFNKEIELISEFNSINDGYNLSEGGQGTGRPIGLSHSDESKRKISESNMGISKGKGVPKSKSHKMAISRAHLGKKKSYRNGRTKEWVILTPTGELINIENLQEFERSNGLSVNSLRNTIRTKKPHYSGFQVVGG